MSKEIMYSQSAPEPIGPYSQAIKSNNMLFVSGQIPFNQGTGKMVSESFAKETSQVMDNIGSILSHAGLSYVDVVKCTIYITDMKKFAEVNEVYAKYFTSKPPARETVQVCALPKDVHVEISCIAVF